MITVEGRDQEGGSAMNRYDAEMSTLFVVEEKLLNAAVSLRSAERRLGDGQLREEIREILR
jgi:hypothetical protein